MRRREFIAGLGGAAAWPLVARAQQGDRVRRIGVLLAGDENDPFWKPRYSAFTRALADLGWTDGRNVRMDLRWGGDDANRIRALAQELVGLQPDIILTGTPAVTAAVQRETRTIPIVFADVTDPVASGIVPRLDRPNGNITGFATFEASLGGKWLELLSEMAPGLKRAAIMFNPETGPVSAFVPSFETAARSLKVEAITAPVHDDVEIETAIIALGREPGGGLVVMPDSSMVARRVRASSVAEIDTSFEAVGREGYDALFVAPDTFFSSRRAQFAAVARRERIPACYGDRETVAAGGLMSCGINYSDVYRQVGLYTGNILKGAKPADLPVVQTSKFELVINRRTATLLGIEVPAALVAIADEVIEE
jgi:putative tryptophan/tyrosine transport system substrate-binding protein